MTGKKGRALAHELMDSLLDEDQELDLEVDSEGAMDSEHSKTSTAQSLTEPVDSIADAQANEAEDDSNFDFSAVASDVHENDSDEGSRTIRISSAEGGLSTAPQKPPVPQSSPLEPDKTEVIQFTGGAAPDIEDKVRASVGRFAGLSSGGRVSPVDASLAQSENLRLAQQRILDLEQELERLRTENEELAAAGETFRRRADELSSREQILERKVEEQLSQMKDEKEVLLKSMQDKDAQLRGLKRKLEEMEARLSTNIQKIRVRERELENRLELVRMEGATLVRSKDEMILDLKRQIDQLNQELENYRNKGQELHQQIGEKQETLKRTVKTLRLALSLLEESDQVSEILKKAK